jgi:hypothetical protein
MTGTLAAMYRAQPSWVASKGLGPYEKEMISVGDGPPVHAVRFAFAVLLGLLEVYFQHDDLAPGRIDNKFIFVAFDSVALHPPDGESDLADQ